MKPWQDLLVIALLIMFALAIRSAVIKNRKRKERDFTRKLETVLQPKETVKLVCPNRGSSCILTSRRLLFDTKEGFQAVPLTKIKKVQGVNKAGNRTAAVPKMVSLTVKAEQDYNLYNTSNQFPELAKQLIKKAAQNNKKKEKKTEKNAPKRSGA